MGKKDKLVQEGRENLCAWRTCRSHELLENTETSEFYVLHTQSGEMFSFPNAWLAFNAYQDAISIENQRKFSRQLELRGYNPLTGRKVN